jgi:hypothetical protein
VVRRLEDKIDRLTVEREHELARPDRINGRTSHPR